MSTIDEKYRDWFTHSVLLRAKEVIDWRILQKAINFVVNNHDSLRTVFTDKPYIRAPADLLYPVETEKFRSVKAMSEYMGKMQRTLSLSKGKLLHASVMSLSTEKENGTYVFITIHNLAMGFKCWPIFLEDLTTAYLAIRNNETPVIPPEVVTYREWLHLQDLDLNYDELKYWKQISEKIDNTTVQKTYPISVKSDIDLSSVGENRYGADARDVILVALAQSYRKLLGKDTLILRIKGHGNRIGDTSRTIGWFTNFHPIEMPISGDIATDIETSKRIRSSIPNHGIGYGVIYSNDLIRHLPDFSVNHVGKRLTYEDRLFESTNDISMGYNSGDVSIGENTFINVVELEKGFMISGFCIKEHSGIPARMVEIIKEILEFLENGKNDCTG